MSAPNMKRDFGGSNPASGVLLVRNAVLGRDGETIEAGKAGANLAAICQDASVALANGGTFAGLADRADRRAVVAMGASNDTTT